MDEMQDMHDVMEMTEHPSAPRRSSKRRSSVAAHAFDSFLDTLGENARTIYRELGLFLGTVLTLVGLLGFSSDKFCDGNTADYLSCTRPSTFYYYDWLHIVLIITGFVFVLLWLLKHTRRSVAS